MDIIIFLAGILDEDQDEVNIFKRKKKLPQNGHVKAEPNHNTMMNGFQKSTKSRPVHRWETSSITVRGGRRVIAVQWKVPLVVTRSIWTKERFQHQKEFVSVITMHVHYEF